MDRVVHFEIPVDDVTRAREFYGSIFDWQLQPMDDVGYTLLMTTAVDEETSSPKDPGAINGGMMGRSDRTPHPVITIEVDSIDDSLKRIEAAGGSTVLPREDMGGMGWFAYFKDPEGNVMGLWETA
jgi:predicted enzyme related to lactoylglutathione lyase